MHLYLGGFPGGSDGKETACSTGEAGWILGSKGLLEKGTAARSNVLTWRIPWTEKSLGSASWAGLSG